MRLGSRARACAAGRSMSSLSGPDRAAPCRSITGETPTHPARRGTSWWAASCNPAIAPIEDDTSTVRSISKRSATQSCRRT